MSLPLPASTAPPPPHQPAGTVPITKLPSTRRYTSEARENMNCKNCRKRKIKCSRTRPSCNACDVFRCECVYDAAPKKRGPRTEVLEELLKRIDGLEKRLGESDGGSGSKYSPPAADGGNTGGAASRPTAPGNETATASPSASPLEPKRSPPAAAAAAVAATSPAALPAATTADPRLVSRLVDIFFERINGKPYTLFHEGMFRQDWADGRVPGCILDTVCAVSVRYASPQDLGTKSVHEYCREFASRARSQVDSDEPTLEHLQSLLLLSMTYFALGDGKKSFMQMGSAIRMTLALDLHRELPASHPATPLEREVRRRIFWTCYLMDRFTVCGSVRPPCFEDRSIHLRLPCSEASFRRAQPSPGPLFCDAGLGTLLSASPQIPNSNLLIDVVRILGRTIRYTQSGGVRGDSHFPWHSASNLSRIRAELNAWAAARDLRDGVPPTPDATSLFLARSVWHVIHCLVYRNFLPIDLAELDGSGTQQAWQMEATKVCFQHANALADLIAVGALTPAIEWPAFAGFSLVTAASVLVHGVFYRGSEAFRRCRDNLAAVLAQVRALTGIWSCMRQQLCTLRTLYRRHEELVAAAHGPHRRPPASVFHLDDFYDRYGGGFEAGHVPFFEACEGDVDLSYMGIPPASYESTSTPSLLLPSPPPLPPHKHQQQHQQQQQLLLLPRYMEEYPFFSPTTPQDLQFLSVGTFAAGHSLDSYECDDCSVTQAYQLGAEREEVGVGVGVGVRVGVGAVQDMASEPSPDPLLSMLAEMAERDDEFGVGMGSSGGGDGRDVWMEEGDG